MGTNRLGTKRPWVRNVRIPSLEHESFEKCAFEVASEQFPSVDMVEELEESLECEKFLFLLRTKTNSLEQIDCHSNYFHSQSSYSKHCLRAFKPLRHVGKKKRGKFSTPVRADKGWAMKRALRSSFNV